MNALKIALLAVVAVLLVVQIVDRARAPAQLAAVKQSVDQLTVAIQQQVQETRALQRTLEAKSFSAPTPGTTTTAENDAARDGKAKLGANFLLPYDPSKFHADWVGGTLKYFEIPPPSINYILENDGATADANALFNDSLCGNPSDRPLLWQENLATSVIISDDYQTYTFTIRKGVMWQRPAIASRKGYEWLDKDVELTAGDFVF
jgi:ABC-type transport system substrate-binding protein